MTKLTHKQKVRLARSMRSRADIIKHTPIFLTDAWIHPSAAIMARVQRRGKKKPA